jgi:hypothetical protein
MLAQASREPLDRGGDAAEVGGRREAVVAGFDQLDRHVVGLEAFGEA